jgi:hypothetical protein
MFSSGFLMMAPAFARSLLMHFQGFTLENRPIHYTPASPQFGACEVATRVFCHRLWSRWHIEELRNS